MSHMVECRFPPTAKAHIVIPRSLLTVCLLSVLMFPGCGGVTPDDKPVVPVASVANIKAAMNDVAKSGTQGSALSSLDSDMERLKTDDAATYEAIKADIDEIKTLTGTAKVKAKAEEILKKLK